MSGMIYHLLEEVNSELSCYNELLSLSQQKTDVIVHNRTSELQQITNREQQIVSKIIKINKTKDELFKDMAIVLNKNEKDLTLTGLADELGSQPKEAESLRTIAKNMRDVIEKLRIVNEQNKTLLESSLEYIEFSMNSLRTINEAPQTASYSKRGNEVRGNDSFFDTRQ